MPIALSDTVGRRGLASCRRPLVFVLAVSVGLAAACSPDSRQAAPASQAPAAAAEPAATPPQAAAPASTPAATPGATSSPAASSAPPAAASAAPAASSQPAPAPAPTSGAAAGGAAAAAAPPPPAPAPKPEPPPAPKYREVTIPAGTALAVTVLSTLASNTSQIEDPVRGALAEPVIVGGRTALPKGTEMSGTVTDAKESARVKGKATIAFRFDRLVFDGETHRIQTARVTQQAEQKKGDDVKKGGVGAGLGAVVGGIAGGGTGAAIGAVAGGAGTVLATKGNEVQITPGTVVTALLQSPLTVRVLVK